MRTFSFIFIFFTTLVFSSCNDENQKETEFEFPPIIISVAYTSIEDDSDLLDSSNPLYVVNRTMPTAVIFKGTTYELNDTLKNTPNQSESNVEFKGLRLGTYEDRNVLVFGELDGSYQYIDEEMIILFGDGHERSVWIYSIWDNNNDGTINITRKYKLYDGTAAKIIKEGSQPVIEFLKPDM